MQTIHLGTAFVNHNISVAGLLDGVELFSQSNSVRIQFKITMDVEGFSALQVVRELKKDDIVTDCLDLGTEN